MFGRERIELKSLDQVRSMRRAGLVVADALGAVRATLRPGVTTAFLDGVAARAIEGAGAVPSFLGYEGYPATICVSVNDEVVHGIPGERVLEVGDVVSVDCGAIVDGWHGDSAFSAVVGSADPEDEALVVATEAAMWAGIAALAGGDRVSVVGEAVEDLIASHDVRYGIVQDYVGHGIGTAMHQAPDVPNYRLRPRGPRLRAGMVLAIEPMLARGTGRTHELDDGWTVVTDDGSRAAHWEHTVALLDGGLWVLTAEDGGAERLTQLGARVAPLE